MTTRKHDTNNVAVTGSIKAALNARLRREQSRGWWRRLERRAIAAYEQDLLAELCTIAGESAEIELFDATAATAGDVVRLQISERLLTIAWVLPTAVNAVAEARGSAPLRIVDAGRYGRIWWITISNGATQTLIGGSRLRLTPVDGGARQQSEVGLDAPSMTL
jgi:hypothetical protein